MPATTVDFTSNISIKINNSPMVESARLNLVEVTIDQHVHLPGMFTIRFFDDGLKLLDGGIVDLLQQVEILSNTPDGKSISLIKGEVTALEPVFDREGRDELVVRGYDKSHRLYRQVNSKSYVNIKDSDIASQIATRGGLRSQITATSIVYKHVVQHNQSDMEFLLQRAWRIGFECYVKNGDTLVFGPPKATAATVTLTRARDLLSFYPRMTLAEQVDKVTVRGWDPATQATIVGSASTGTLYPSIGESKNGASWAKGFGKGEFIMVDHPLENQGEADALAVARLNELSGSFLQAEGVAFRRPDVRAGETVKLVGLGERLSGTYLVTSATHVYNVQEGFTTTFQVRGVRTGLLAEEIAPRSTLDRWFGVYPATVTNNKDDENTGRVKVKYPWLSDTVESFWARVAYVGAGNGHGLMMVPMVNDEVLVAFEQGDFNRPIVIGSLWSAKNKPNSEIAKAVNAGKTEIRSWRTPAGHLFALFETADDKHIDLKTAGGHYLLFDDTKKVIEIKTAGGLVITMEDTSKKITIKGAGEILVDAGTNMTLNAAANMTIKAGAQMKLEAGAAMNLQANAAMDLKANATMNVQASGPTTIKGAIVQIN